VRPESSAYVPAHERYRPKVARTLCAELKKKRPNGRMIGAG